MKTVTLPAIIFASVFLLQSCGSVRMPISTHVPENNKNYEVDFLLSTMDAAFTVFTTGGIMFISLIAMVKYLRLLTIQQ